MARSFFRNAKINPFETEVTEKCLIVFQPTPYTLAVVMSLPPVEMRTFVALLAHLQPDGCATATLSQLTDMTANHSTAVYKALKRLSNKELIARRGHSQYWVNPEFGRPLLIR